jgi:hypothetical protein
MTSELMMTLAQGRQAELRRAAEQARLAQTAPSARRSHSAHLPGVRLVAFARPRRPRLATAPS